MRHYEIVALVHPDQSAQIDEIVARYRKIVEDSGGQIHRQENWGRRKLAYPIKKVYKADYFLLNVECDSSVKDRIENEFKYYDSIIRSLFIRKDHAETEQSPILTKLIKQEEEERIAKEREEAEMVRLRAEEAAKAEEAEKAEKQRIAEKEAAQSNEEDGSDEANGTDETAKDLEEIEDSGDEQIGVAADSQTEVADTTDSSAESQPDADASEPDAKETETNDEKEDETA